MNWSAVDSTLRKTYRRNGREVAIDQGSTPLDELMARDPTPELGTMTADQLLFYAESCSIPIAKDLDRLEMIDLIKEALEADWHERLRGMRQTLDYIFADGAHPLAVVRRCYSIVKAVRPALVHGMSCADLAVLCDDGKGRMCDGRATVSARIKRLFNEPIRRQGMHGFKAAFQKDDSASHAYTGSAQGNQNRLGRAFIDANRSKKKKVA